MAQAGYTPILIYASGTATNIPTAGNLISGSSGAELAINYADGKLYYKDGSGNVKLLSIGYGSSSVTPTNGGVQYGTGTALALTAAGSSGQILRSNGAAAPTWADLSTLGVNTISFGTTGLTPNSATAGAVTVAGTLVTANGGTGLGGATPFTANGVLYASSASALTSGSALTFDGSVFQTSLGTGLVTNTKQLVLNNFTGEGVGITFSRTTDSTEVNAIGTANSNWDMGIFARENILFAIGGASTYSATTEQMRLNSTGLGIGTSSPGAKLHAISSAGTSGNTLPGNATAIFESGANMGIAVSAPAANVAGVYFPRSTDAYYAGVERSDTNLLLRNNGATQATLDSSGNLGLGVTPSAWNNIFKALQINSQGALMATSASMQMGNNVYYDGAYKFIGTGYANRYYQASGQHVWTVSTVSGSANGTITETQAMTLDASGNLGIGETAPATPLSGAKGLVLKGSADTQIRLQNTNTGSASTDGFLLSIDSSASALAYVWNYENAALIFGTNNTERARIDSSGNFLVGTTSASSKLTVNSEISIGADGDNRAIVGYTPSRFYIGTRQGGTNYFDTVSVSSGNLLVGQTSSVGANGGKMEIYTADNYNGAPNLALNVGANNTGGIYLYFTNAAGTKIGSVTQASSTSVAYNTTSDYRLKENIQPMTGALARVQSLKPVTFNWKDDGSSSEGFIAHELQEIIPKAVVGSKDAVDAEGKPNYQGIDTSFLVATLTAAIQEQQALIATLTARVAALEAA